jgi:ribokinase
MNEKRRGIAVIGSSNIDFTMKMARLPRLGECVTDAVFMQTYGGKGANQAVAAARAGGETWFVNCVGNDELAPRMVENFRRDGIHTDFVFRAEGTPSGTALVMIGEQGANYLSVAPGANYRLTPAHIELAMPTLARCAVVLFQYEIPTETLVAAMRRARQSGATVILNFAPAREFPRESLRDADIIVVNEPEAEFLAAMPVGDALQAAAAADALLDLGVRAAVITLGSRGAWVASKDLRGPIPPFGVEVVDTTAAGDTFCGALAVGLAERMPLDRALRFASAAAALTVTKMGAQPSIPRRAEIEDFLRGRGG